MELLSVCSYYLWRHYGLQLHCIQIDLNEIDLDLILYQPIIQTIYRYIMCSIYKIIKTYIHNGLPAVILLDPIDFSTADIYNQYAVAVGCKL